MPDHTPGRPARRPFHFMITSPDNEQLKTIRKLQQKKERTRSGLFAAEGEDLVEAAAAAGLKPVILLRSGEDVEPELLDAVSSLGSGTRVIGVYEQRLGGAGGRPLRLPARRGRPGQRRHRHPLGTRALRRARDPGARAAPIRSRRRPCGPRWARSSRGRPRAARIEELGGTARGTGRRRAGPAGGGRGRAPAGGLPRRGAGRAARGAGGAGGGERPDPDPRRAARTSLNVAMAATVALYDLGHRMAGHA